MKFSKRQNYSNRSVVPRLKERRRLTLELVRDLFGVIEKYYSTGILNPQAVSWYWYWSIAFSETGHRAGGEQVKLHLYLQPLPQS